MARIAFGGGVGIQNPDTLHQRGGGVGPVADPIGGIATATTDIATAITDFTAAVGASSGDSLKELLINQTWTAGTLQLSGTPGSSATLTAGQQEGLQTLINAVGTALLQVQADLAAVPAANDVVISVNTANITTSGVLLNVVTRLIKAICGQAAITP